MLVTVVVFYNDFYVIHAVADACALVVFAVPFIYVPADINYHFAPVVRAECASARDGEVINHLISPR